MGVLAATSRCYLEVNTMDKRLRTHPHGIERFRTTSPRSGESS